MQLHNAYAQHKGGTRSLRDSNWMSIDIALDILGGCDHKCPGCFVNKSLPFVEDDLETIADLVDQFKEQHYDFNELFLGPTDVFSATNFEQVVTNEYFKQLSNHFTFTCTSTCLNDLEVTKKRLEMLEEHCSNWCGRNFEIFVVIDIPKYLADDREYLDKFNANLSLMCEDNVFFLLNVYSEDMFKEISLIDLTIKLKQDYNTKVRINPSYFRGTNKKHIERYAHMHRDMIESEINDDNIQLIFLNMLDIYFGGFTFGNYAFTQHELYVAPTIYEAVPIIHDSVQIKKRDNGKYKLEDLVQIQTDLFLAQMEYAKNTTECNSCKYLSSCASRNVLSYMESRKIQDCFLPKKLFRDASCVIELETRNVT